jgi:integrase
MTDLQAILNWSTRRRPALIRFNPVLNYKAPKEDNEIILPPTPEETAAIIKHASPHLVRAIKLSYYLGLRPGAVELLSLNWLDVNWQSKTILVRSAHKGGPVRRHVPIHDDFIEGLKAWWDSDEKAGPVIHYMGRPVKSLRRTWRETLRRAGITRRIRPYDMRHNFITMALEGGADIKALAEVVGSSPETIRKYYQHVTRKQHRKTVATIPPLK